MSGRKKRLAVIGAGLAALAATVGLILKSLEDNILFFHSPTQLVQMDARPQGALRVGGLVKADSVVWRGDKVSFVITDLEHELTISYQGVLPDLFREGQGVIAEGAFDNNKSAFQAKLILAKHDENYMPPEVAALLKEKQKQKQKQKQRQAK